MIMTAGYRREIKCSNCGKSAVKQFETEPDHAIQDLRDQKFFQEHCQFCNKFTTHEILGEKP